MTRHDTKLALQRILEMPHRAECSHMHTQDYRLPPGQVGGENTSFSPPTCVWPESILTDSILTGTGSRLWSSLMVRSSTPDPRAFFFPSAPPDS